MSTPSHAAVGDPTSNPTPTEVQVIALSELQDAGQTPALRDRVVADLNPLHQVRASIRVQVGEAEVSVGELLSATLNQILVLDRGIDEEVELLVEGAVVARGVLVAIDGRFAVRITALPVALGLGNAGT